ncbi:MAG: D-glycero-beta-D-manno-heptose 1-phosphate adenylyltransferase [Bacteroidia bacterium]|jgi:rfaE bifunctional protein nucleotidyltransferase chain/domain
MHSFIAPEQKMLSSEALLAFCLKARNDAKTIAFTNGCFDILHRGHLEYLLKASQLADYLIVGLNSDASVRRLKGPERPLNEEHDRAFALACLNFTDSIVVFEEDTPLRLIETIIPDVLIKGGDYTLDSIVGAKETLARGGKVEIIPFSMGYSTTGIIKKIKG